MQASNDADGPFNLAGRTVLVAESEPIIALDLDDMLRELGCVAAGFVSSTGDALLLLERERPDAALINPKLSDGSALPFVLALRRSGVPFALVSGRENNSHAEPALQQAPHLDWPYGARELQRLLVRLLEHREHGPELIQEAEIGRPGAAGRDGIASASS